MINSIFIVINLAIFVALCIYIIKKHVIPFVQSHIVSEQIYHSTLTNRKDLLSKQYTGLERELLHQKHLYEILSEKIDRWNAAVAHDRQNQIKHLQHFADVATQRHQTQMLYQEKIRIDAYILPRAVQEAGDKLVHETNSSETAKKYMHHILTFMRKEIQ